MFGIPEWAIGVGVIRTAVFAGIGIMVRLLPPKTGHSRPRELSQDQQQKLQDLERRLGEVENVQSRFAEIEERLDFTERLLAKQRDADRLPPPSACRLRPLAASTRASPGYRAERRPNTAMATRSRYIPRP